LCRCRGAEEQMWGRGAKVLRCRGADMEVLRCKAADVEVLMC
jgi:hypothetical protein